MLVISIDGACRRNGKPDCVASGAVFIKQYDEENNLVATRPLSMWELKSTNQRGELLALLKALDYIYASEQHAQIITDSEYIFNAMTKEWCVGWESRGWKTAMYEPVKNSDIWKAIKQVYDKCLNDKNLEVLFYHIKGHCIPFGKVTANTLLDKDNSGMALLEEVYKKYDKVSGTPKREQLLQSANELSLKNNGYTLSDTLLRDFVVANTVADAIATKCVDIADSLLS